MKHEELLEKLAMELAEWPAYKDYMQWDGDEFYPTDYLDNQPFTKQDWLAERERLINKPSWDDAPAEATVLVQDDDGYWHFGHCPNPDYPQAKDSGNWESGPGGKWLSGVSRRKGKFPAGHSWTQTLERRPTEEFDSEARMTVIATNGNDGLHYPKQDRYQDQQGEDWIDECARTLTPEQFRGAMMFTIGKYVRRLGKKDGISQEVRKIADYAQRWQQYEESRESTQ